VTFEGSFSSSHGVTGYANSPEGTSDTSGSWYNRSAGPVVTGGPVLEAVPHGLLAALPAVVGVV
jgi:hypothetical protein